MADDSTPSMLVVYVFVYCLLEGLQRVSGVFFFSLLELLGMSRLYASVPFLVSRVTANWTGVLLQHIDDYRLKPRKWILWGCFLAAAGMALCFLTNEALWLAVFWGIVFGAGIGITIPLLIAELTKDTNQTALSCLLPASPSFGCILFPFLITICISSYGLGGCFLIIAGLILNSIPLICVAKYHIYFRLPKPKWHLRKRSKRYQMSQKAVENNNVATYKSRRLEEFSNDSFLENLEPDTLQKVSDADDLCATNYGFVDIFQPIIDAKRKMTNGENKPTDIDMDQNNDECSNHKDKFVEKLSEIVADVQMYENHRKVFEGSFTNKDVVSQGTVSSVYSSEHECTKEGEPECSKGSDSGHSSVESLETEEWKDVDNNEKTPNSQPTPPAIISSTNTTFHMKKSQGNQSKSNFPLEIKVHVVECTITTNAEFYDQPLDVPQPRQKAARRHSNSLIPGCYDNIDFTKLLLNNKSSPLQKQQVNQASRMFLITEEDETEFDKRLSVCCNADIEASRNESTPNTTITKKFRRLLNPSCWIILYAFVTYELTLSILLTMFSDFAKDSKDTSVSSNLVLVAFGLGGVAGQLSFTHWGTRLLSDGSHAAAAVIFMLNGLSVAGILWSATIGWIAGFYAVLGFVESGILLILPRTVADFIEERSVELLSSTCKCVSGIAILFMPFAMGLSRDAAGNYDGLLQVTSCLSVLCALLCYFLPRLRRKDKAASR